MHPRQGEGSRPPKDQGRAPWLRRWGCVGLLLAAACSLAPPPEQARADEFDVVDPLIATTQQTLLALPSGAGSFMFVEGWRQYALALMDIDKTKEREAML